MKAYELHRTQLLISLSSVLSYDVKSIPHYRELCNSLFLQLFQNTHSFRGIGKNR